MDGLTRAEPLVAAAHLPFAIMVCSVRGTTMSDFPDELINQILCGDCVKLMAELLPDECVDLVMADPPYPNLTGGFVRDERFQRAGKTEHVSVTVGTPWDVSLDWMQEAWRVTRYGMMCFCSYHNVADFRNALPQAKAMGLITWYIRNQAPSGKNVPRHDTQFIWLFNKQPGLDWDKFKTMLIDVPSPPAGCFASERLLFPGTGKAAHPTQKPLKLILELLKVGGDLVLDPFVGSGTTAVAAKQLGRNYLGFDISPEYCKLARRRIEQTNPPLFVL